LLCWQQNLLPLLHHQALNTWLLLAVVVVVRLGPVAAVVLAVI
jgi:hypothetical protein